MIERIRAMGERLGGDVFVRHTAQARESDLQRLAISEARPWSWRRTWTDCAAWRKPKNCAMG
jgi:hypothetical protein